MESPPEGIEEKLPRREVRFERRHGRWCVEALAACGNSGTVLFGAENRMAYCYNMLGMLVTTMVMSVSNVAIDLRRWLEAKSVGLDRC